MDTFLIYITCKNDAFAMKFKFDVLDKVPPIFHRGWYADGIKNKPTKIKMSLL